MPEEQDPIARYLRNFHCVAAAQYQHLYLRASYVQMNRPTARLVCENVRVPECREHSSQMFKKMAATAAAPP
jgi:hypothetical protein